MRLKLYLIGAEAHTDESTALLSVVHTAGRIVMTHQRCGVREQGSPRIARSKHEQQPGRTLDTSSMICIVCDPLSSVHVSMMYISTRWFLPGGK